MSDKIDGRRNNGGHSTKGFAGRPKKVVKETMLTKLGKHITDEQVFARLADRIDDGDLKAMQLYMAYKYGRPKETKDITITTEQPLFNLEVVEDIEYDEVLLDEALEGEEEDSDE